MKIPSQISIGGLDWKIQFHDKDFMNQSNQKMVGNVNFRDGLINISSDLNEQLVDLTFLHEITHAVDYTLGFLVDDNDDPEHLPITEKTVETRAQLWLQVIKQLIDFNIIEEMCPSMNLKKEDKTILNLNIN